MLLALTIAACAPDEAPGSATEPLPCPSDDCVPASDLPPGDADAGYAAIVNEGYLSCGFPFTIYEDYPILLPGEPAEGRIGDAAGLAYEYSVATSPDGVRVLNKNCLSCHASYLDGELVIGLGNVLNDSSDSIADMVTGMRLLITDPAELAELDRLDRRAAVIDRYVTDTIGMSRGDTLVHAFLTHLDPETLAWSDAPLIEEPAEPGIPIDVPPWWRMGKKNAMFYNTAIRGDWTRWTVNEAFACLESIEAADEVMAYSDDIAAFVSAIAPPAYPRAIDADLAADGEAVFVESCARCHGTQGPDGQYLNAVIPVAEVGTDPAMADAVGDWHTMWDEMLVMNVPFSTDVNWEPQAGYIAPPLDGV